MTNRKDDHIRLALNQEQKSNRFDDMFLESTDLPGFGLDDVNLKTNYLNYEIDFPIYINAMTGGTKESKNINLFLAKIANHFNIPLITGSQSIALKDESTISSFSIIRDYHQGILLGNINPNYGLKDALKAIHMIKANGLTIHLNVLQELVMPEGDRDFTNWETNIKEILSNINKPVIVKQVGAGLSNKTILKLKELGVKNIDISGAGGTSFLKIESDRGMSDYSYLSGFEKQTLDVLLSLKNELDLNIFASGGIRNPLDVIKSLVLGAKAVGLSKYFLSLYQLGFDKAVIEVNNFMTDLKKIMVLIGAKSINDLKNIDYKIKS